MFCQNFHISRKACFTGLVFIFVIVWSVSLWFVYFVSEYRIDQHSNLFRKRIQDLPSKDIKYFNSRRIDFDGWSPGKHKLLVDPTEFHTHFRKEVTATGYHEILYYNARPDYLMKEENKMFDSCQYKNCHLTVNRSLYNDSSAVIFELSHRMIGHAPRTRPKDQVWIFHDYEPPCINGKWDHRHRSWDGKFNWSMTYRLDSDIIRPYGYLKTRNQQNVERTDYHNVFNRKTKFAAWIVSNCETVISMSERHKYVKELQKYIPVDIYGDCGTLVVNRTREATQEMLKDYKFFLSFENSFCTDYVTEKFFQFLMMTDAILVVRGGADYDNLLPEYTHINAQHFQNSKELAQYLIYLNNTEIEYVKFLQTRDKYELVYMNWACNLCIKLNNKTAYPKVYKNVVDWWHVDKCWFPHDVIAIWSAIDQYTVILIVVIILLSIGTVVYVLLRKQCSSYSEITTG